MLTQHTAQTLRSGLAHSLAFPPSHRPARSPLQPLRCHRLAWMPRRRSPAATVRALAGQRKMEQVWASHGSVAETAAASAAMKRACAKSLLRSHAGVAGIV